MIIIRTLKFILNLLTNDIKTKCSFNKILIENFLTFLTQGFLFGEGSLIGRNFNFRSILWISAK